MIKGFDCYGPLTQTIITKAKLAGFKFVGRYYGTGGKILYAPEAKLISDNDLSIIVYQSIDQSIVSVSISNRI